MMESTMKTDNHTKEKLLLCAKEEFMEKGFQNASLRKICVRPPAPYCSLGGNISLLCPDAPAARAPGAFFPADAAGSTAETAWGRRPPARWARCDSARPG